MGIIGFYSTLFLLSKIGGKKKKPAAAPVAEHKVTTTTAEGGIPAVDSPGIKYIHIIINFIIITNIIQKLSKNSALGYRKTEI